MSRWLRRLPMIDVTWWCNTTARSSFRSSYSNTCSIQTCFFFCKYEKRTKFNYVRIRYPLHYTHHVHVYGHCIMSEIIDKFCKMFREYSKESSNFRLVLLVWTFSLDFHLGPYIDGIVIVAMRSSTILTIFHDKFWFFMFNLTLCGIFSFDRLTLTTAHITLSVTVVGVFWHTFLLETFSFLSSAKIWNVQKKMFHNAKFVISQYCTLFLFLQRVKCVRWLR